MSMNLDAVLFFWLFVVSGLIFIFDLLPRLWNAGKWVWRHRFNKSERRVLKLKPMSEGWGRDELPFHRERKAGR